MGGPRTPEHSGRVRLLDVDPALAERLGRDEEPVAASHSVMPTVTLTRGLWSPNEQAFDGGAYGLSFYVIGGLMARHVSVGGHRSVELLGPGELLRPSLQAEDVTLVTRTSWQVLQRTYLGVIDRHLWTRLADWPEISLALLDRVLQRSRSLSVRLALVQDRQLECRLTALFWHLADRYGHVSPQGVVLPLPLSHETLADLVSAQRPSVSVALKRLAESGGVTRRSDRSWLLIARPPNP